MDKNSENRFRLLPLMVVMTFVVKFKFSQTLYDVWSKWPENQSRFVYSGPVIGIWKVSSPRFTFSNPSATQLFHSVSNIPIFATYA